MLRNKNDIKQTFLAPDCEKKLFYAKVRVLQQFATENHAHLVANKFFVCYTCAVKGLSGQVTIQFLDAPHLFLLNGNGKFAQIKKNNQEREKMGFFNFFQNKNTPNQTRQGGDLNLDISFNYQFVFLALKRVCFSNKMDLASFYGHKESVQSLLFEIAKTLGRKIPNGYEKLNVAFEKNDEKLAIVIELPDPKQECDCNYVGLAQKTNGNKEFYTNELFEFTQTYQLCMSTLDAHFVYALKPQNLQEFAQAMLKLNK